MLAHKFFFPSSLFLLNYVSKLYKTFFFHYFSHTALLHQQQMGLLGFFPTTLCRGRDLNLHQWSCTMTRDLLKNSLPTELPRHGKLYKINNLSFFYDISVSILYLSYGTSHHSHQWKNCSPAFLAERKNSDGPVMLVASDLISPFARICSSEQIDARHIFRPSGSVLMLSHMFWVRNIEILVFT